MTNNKKDSKDAKKSQVKIGKLQVNKETVKDLTDKEAEQVKGGAFNSVVVCNPRTEVCITGTIFGTNK